MKTIEVDYLADVHTHLREAGAVAPLIAEAINGGADVFGVMPNTTKGLNTAQSVDDYVNRLKRRTMPWADVSFIPFVQITERTTERDIDECVKEGIVDGKIYPYLRTTKSGNGVVRYGRILPIIKHCGEVGMTCHFHPEHPSMIFGNRDAEFVFLPIIKMYLEETITNIVWEHGTDARCIPHWEDMARSSGRFILTLTAHHLAANEDLTFGDVRSVCKPPIKTERDRQGLIDLVAKDYWWVMAGGDSAFHDRSTKYVNTGCCACGAFTGPFLLQLYAHALDDILVNKDGVRTFVNFTSRNARKFHHLPESPRVRMTREPWQIPISYSIGTRTAVPFWAGQTLNWKLVG